MKTLDYYMSLSYPIEIIPDEGGFLALLPDLPGCMSSGANIPEAIAGLEEAKVLWIEGRLEEHQPIPEPTEIEDYSGKFVLRIPRSLHKALDREAKKEGVSLNQYLVHLLSERHNLVAAEHTLDLVLNYAAKAAAQVLAQEPEWSWHEDMIPGQVHTPAAKYDPIGMLHELFGRPKRHRSLVVEKPGRGMTEAFN